MPKKYLSPGVYIEEVSAQVPPIGGVATSIGAFVGRTMRGRAGVAVECFSFADFLRKFGGSHSQSELEASVKLFFENGGSVCYVIRVSLRALEASAAFNNKVLKALDDVDIFNLMIVPRDRDITELQHRSLLISASEYCGKRGAMLLIDVPESWPAKVDAATIETFCSGIDKRSAAIFYPRIVIDDGTAAKTIGPAGAIAGMFVRTDVVRGVWKAPAGTEAVLRSVADVERAVNDSENSRLNKLGVNCIRKFPQGILNWGARTLVGADGSGMEWKYVNVRRMFTYLEHSIDSGTQWAVFEPNDVRLWVMIRSSIERFLTDLWRKGAFQGSKPEHAFYVRCGLGETMTQNDIENGRIIVEVGFAPIKPAEFVVLRFYHKNLLEN